MFERELDLLQPGFNVADDSTQVTAGHFRTDIEAPLAALVLDEVRRWPDRDRRDVAERHRATVGLVDRHPPDVTDAVARFGRAPDLHVVGLAGAEDVADFFTRHDRPRGSPHVTRLDPVGPRLGEIDVDFDLRDLGL